MRLYPLALILFLPFVTFAEEPVKDTMTVHGEGTVRLAPDQLTLPVTVTEENTSLDTAKEKHDSKLRKLLKLASDLGIPKEKTQTSYTSVSPVYDYEKDSSRRAFVATAYRPRSISK